MDELSELEQRIKNKILQTKGKMHTTRERAVTDRLWPEIETLNWVLNEILVLRQRDEGFYSNT
jgi:hypothetical protein